MANNWDLYFKRVEPEEVKQGSDYVNLRTCTDVEKLRSLEAVLKKHDKDPVLVPWISPPCGEIRGYGIYAREEAEGLLQQAKEEFWGFPRVGRGYDLAWFGRRIDRLSNTHYVPASR